MFKVQTDTNTNLQYTVGRTSRKRTPPPLTLEPLPHGVASLLCSPLSLSRQTSDGDPSSRLTPSSSRASADLQAPVPSSSAAHPTQRSFLAMAGRHTIILMQPSQNRGTRTFMDYNSVNHALDGICGLYERKIRDINPMIPNITYDITDLYNFIDGLADISALVYDHTIQAFLPYDRQWIKQKLFQHLKKLAQR
nr:enhancer of rudimentary homolog [Lolium perenne]